MTAAPRPAPTPLRASLADLNLDKEVGSAIGWLQLVRIPCQAAPRGVRLESRAGDARDSIVYHSSRADVFGSTHGSRGLLVQLPLMDEDPVKAHWNSLWHSHFGYRYLRHCLGVVDLHVHQPSLSMLPILNMHLNTTPTFSDIDCNMQMSMPDGKERQPQ
jgi:hypothetical protein